MPFTAYEAALLGKEIGKGNQIGDLRESRVVKGFREKFDFHSRSAVARACGMNPSYLSKVETGKRKFGIRALVGFMIGTFELVMATSPERRQEYVKWLFEDFLPTIYQVEQDTYERRSQIMKEAHSVEP